VDTLLVYQPPEANTWLYSRAHMMINLKRCARRVDSTSPRHADVHVADPADVQLCIFHILHPSIRLGSGCKVVGLPMPEENHMELFAKLVARIKRRIAQGDPRPERRILCSSRGYLDYGSRFTACWNSMVMRLMVE
jgi:hypothetical protein